MHIIGSKDCGNSPKNQFVQTVSIALIVGDSSQLSEVIQPDAIWEIAGQRSIDGCKAITAHASATAGERSVSAIRIDHAIAHGRTGIANGRLKFESGQMVAFCNIFEFANAKGTLVRAITTLKVPL